MSLCHESSINHTRTTGHNWVKPRYINGFNYWACGQCNVVFWPEVGGSYRAEELFHFEYIPLAKAIVAPMRKLSDVA